MGYTTYFYGEIWIKDKQLIEDIKEDMEKGFSEKKDFDFYESDFEGNRFVINEDWKDCGGMIEICKKIAKRDKKADGLIDCYGEERDDLWRIKIYEGKVSTSQGKVTYDNFKEEVGE